MNRNGHTSPTTSVRQGLGGLLHDVATLGELQIELLKIDAGSASRRAIVPAGLIGAGVIFALSVIPLVLLAVAQVLRDQAGWPPALATLTAALIGILIAVVCGGLGYLGLKRVMEPLARSRDELSRNVAWLKTALQRQDTQQHAATAQAGPLWPNSPR